LLRSNTRGTSAWCAIWRARIRPETHCPLSDDAGVSPTDYWTHSHWLSLSIKYVSMPRGTRELEGNSASPVAASVAVIACPRILVTCSGSAGRADLGKTELLTT